MLSRKELEELIKAWPDENGVSSNSEIYDQWIFSQNQYFVDKVYMALGNDRGESDAQALYTTTEEKHVKKEN